MLDKIRTFKFAYYWLRKQRKQQKAYDEMQEFLLECSRHKAKKHIYAMSDIFATMNMYLPKKQHIRISLKVPK